MNTPAPGTYDFSGSGRLTVIEPITASNPPAGSASWPVVEVSSPTRVALFPTVYATPRDEIVALSRQLAERLASVPADQRAELLAEISRSLAAAG